MAENTATLDEAVKGAVETVEKQENQQTETQQTETKTSETTEVKVDAEQQARNERIDKAVRLYEALEDPNVGPAILKQLAERAGILGVKEGKTEQQVTKSVNEVLREGLGPEYEFLADKLGPAIDKIVKGIVEQQIQPVRESNREATERMVKAETDAVFEKFESAHKDFKEHESAMLELSKEMPYTGEISLEKYLGNLYKIATSDKKEAATIKKTVDKINANAREVRDASTEVQETRVTKGSKLPSLDEAMRAAMRGERLA